MADVISIDREWVGAELVGAIDQERALSSGATARAGSPPHDSLTVLYHEIAESDLRHAAILEIVATRYGHTPRDPAQGGVSGILGQLKAQVGELGSLPFQQVWNDVAAKARWIHWLAAWAHTFETLGDLDSARDLASVISEEKEHQDALQSSLNRLIQSRATADDHTAGSGVIRGT